MKHPQREYQRVYLTFYLRVFEGDDFIGFLIDISREGLMVMSEKSFGAEQPHTLRMKIPASISGEEDDHYVQFQAMCRWCRCDELDKDVYLCGFQIQDIPENENDLIKKLIDEYRLR